MLYWGWVIWWQRWRVVPATDRWRVTYMQQSLLGMTVQNILLLLTVQICVTHCDCVGVLKSNSTKLFTAFCLTLYCIFRLSYSYAVEFFRKTSQYFSSKEKLFWESLNTAFWTQSEHFAIFALQTGFSVLCLALPTVFSVQHLALPTVFSVQRLALPTVFLYSVAISQVPPLSGLVPRSKLCCTCCGPVKYCGTAVPRSDWRKKQQHTSVGT